MTAAFCAACGARLAADNRFCEHCGAAIASRQAGRASGSPETVAHYRLEGVIAEGGMGVVHRAYDERLGRTVAIKLLREDVAADDEFRRRFISESRGAASLDHPNILPVFDAGEADGTLYIATRLVDGEDLRRLVAREGPLAVDRALRIAAQVAAALDYAHGRGIVHRDVKPANVLVVPGSGGEPEHAYLIDFGVIKQADRTGPEVTMAGRFVGTPEYAAPEQIVGEPVTGRADQYALGGILYHCLVGQSPYADTSSAAVMQAHLSAPAPHVAAERRDVPAALDAALARAMDKNPSRRFASCRAFVTAAQTTSSETAIDTPRPIAEPAPAIAADPARGGRKAAWIAAAVVLVAAAGGGAAVAAGGLDRHHDAPASTGEAAARPRPRARAAQVPATATDPSSQTAPASTAPTATTPTTTVAAAFDVDRLSLEPHQMVGYRVSLPSAWPLTKDDEPQVTSGDVTRRRTTASDSSRPVSVVIDHLTHFDLTPEENRSDLEASYPSTVAGYAFVADSDYDLAGRTTYEWRYERTQDRGTRVQRVDLMFRDGADDFAVLATGRGEYDTLADLAKAVAATITVSDAGADDAPTGSTAATSPPPIRDPRLPATGVYTGTGTQHLSAGDNQGVALVMSFGNGSSVAYTKSSCTARLIPAGYDGRSRVYHERFTSSGCDDPGTWKVLKTSDTEVRASWSAPGDDYTVTADLQR